MTCSSRQKKAMQIPLKQSWKKVSRPRSHKETRAKEQQLKLITASTLLPLCRATGPNRETPTNYVDAGLLHTAGTEYANKNFSTPIPQKNKKNLSTPKPPTTLTSKARHTARPYTLYKRPCTEARADAVRLSHMDKPGVQFTGMPSHPRRARRAATRLSRTFLFPLE